MVDDFELYGTNWEGGGYFTCPEAPRGTSLPRDIFDKPWYSWTVILVEAKLGQFGHVSKLLDLYSVKDPVLRSICFELFGDAAPSSAFSPLIEQIESNKNIDRILYSCVALAVRGRLADIPIMMEAYMRNFEYRDASTIPVQICKVIGEISPTPMDVMSPDSYRRQVIARCQELADRFGSEDVFLFRGELISATRLAQLVLQALRKPGFSFQYRHRFEAVTGINSTAFYNDDEELQPLAAAAIVEEFLESGGAEEYEEGVRYFFGHRVPD